MGRSGMDALVLAPSATPASVSRTGVAATAPPKENQTSCSNLVRSSQATPTETAKAVSA
jgi:hypothetical protein